MIKEPTSGGIVDFIQQELPITYESIDVNAIPLEGNERIWRSLNETQLADYGRRIYDHYREQDFPYYEYTDKEKRREYQKLLDFNFDSIVDDRDGEIIIRQTMHSLGLAWSYFPHSWEVKCNGFPTPMEIYRDDDLFMTTVMKRLKFGTFITDAGIRKALRTYCHAQSVSNFRPSAAAAIYRYFAKRVGHPINTWDMSAGFGGRLLGAWASNSVSRYVGSDPSSKTYVGLIYMAQDMKRIAPKTELHDAMFLMRGSEDCHFKGAHFDLCFTSPPYFNTEKYSDESSQSYVRYSDYSQWLMCFWGNTVRNAVAATKPGGYVAVNVANVNSAPKLAQDVLQVMIDNGLVFEREIKLALSSRAKNDSSPKYKYESIWITQKI